MTAELRSGGGDNDRLCDGRWGDASYSGGGSNTSGEIHGQLFRGTQPILGGLIKTNSGKSFVITPPGKGGGERVTGAARQFIIRNFISENKSLLRKQTLKRITSNHTRTIKYNCFKTLFHTSFKLYIAANKTIKSEGQTENILCICHAQRCVPVLSLTLTLRSYLRG